MTFNQLRTFVAVVDCGSVSEAADDLLVSPPAVSAALATLQAELGVALVARAGRGLTITAAGRVFDSYARRVLQMVDEGVAATREALDPEMGRVRLAAVTTAGEHVLPRFLASFRARHPDAEVSLEVGNRERLWQMLGEREVDLAIGGRPPRGGGFVTRATRPNVLVLVAAASPRPHDSDGPHVREVDVDELARQVLLLREPGSGTRSTAVELYEELGVSPSAVLTLGSNGALRESVQVGLGVTLISRDAVARELDEGTLEEWRCPTLPRHRAWHLVSRAGEDLAPTAELFLSHVTADAQEGFVLVGHPAAG
jgi:LysR family transcriptional regulator, low CO2-responsive transcriptional regulator